MTIEELEQLCRDYDAWHGEWPEHQYEGWSLLRYIRARLKGHSANIASWPYAENDVDMPSDWASQADERRVRL